MLRNFKKTKILHKRKGVTLRSIQKLKFQSNKNQGIKISTGSGSPPFTLKPDSVDAGIAIANLLNSLFTSQIRRSAVKKAIICTNDSLQIYGQGLISIYREAYLNGLLALETTQINDYYPSYAAILIERDAPPLDRVQLESEYNNLLELLSKREDSVKTYISFIQNTLTTHSKLRDMFVKDKSSKEISSYWKNYLNTNNSSKGLKSTDSSFEVINSMSRREETMAVKILAKYQLSIAPQVKKNHQK